jgi:tRNA pseudouridine38-40 synthase
MGKGTFYRTGRHARDNGAVPRFLLRLAYDGTCYVGWQRQLNGMSVQQRVEEALEPLAGGPASVVGAGRTDAGVHALGQAAHVDLPHAVPADVLVRALNSRLPADIRIRRAELVAGDVHARFSAVGKSYRYRWLVSRTGLPLLERDAWRVLPSLDLGAMRDAGDRLAGTHDFAGFQSTGTDIETTVRTLTSVSLCVTTVDDAAALGLGPDEYRLDLDITGTGFLRHMVRAIAGTLTDIGRGRWTAGRIDELLRHRDRALAGPTAPAHGLTLVGVDYGSTLPSALPASIQASQPAHAATPEESGRAERSGR